VTGVLLDTHVWAWGMIDLGRISDRAVQAVQFADRVHIASVSFYEITQKVRLGKWAEMAGPSDRLEQIAAERGVKVLDLGPGLASAAGLLDWPHRDPFDRIIAATAVVLDLTLISADPVFDALPLRRVW
jgi:PIN domain nuclease of toxin-antitoxin system